MLLFAANGAADGDADMAVTISAFWAAEGIAAIDAAVPLLPIELRARLRKVQLHLERMSAEAEIRPTGPVTCPRCHGSRYEAVACADGTYETRCLLCDGCGAVDRQTALALAAGLALERSGHGGPGGYVDGATGRTGRNGRE